MNAIKDANGMGKLLDALENFSSECREESEMCRYFENYIKIIETIKNLVRAGRDGNFLLHIKTVGELCSILLEVMASTT